MLENSATTAVLQWKNINEGQMTSIATKLASIIHDQGILYLRGELGAGKTTFARAFLSAFGVGERIKSPTYSLIESYEVKGRSIHHLDLYRIADPEELHWLGLADLTSPQALLVIEWPERGASSLPEPDLIINFAHTDQRGRDLSLIAMSSPAYAWIAQIKQILKLR